MGISQFSKPLESAEQGLWLSHLARLVGTDIPVHATTMAAQPARTGPGIDENDDYDCSELRFVGGSRGHLDPRRGGRFQRIQYVSVDGLKQENESKSIQKHSCASN